LLRIVRHGARGIGASAPTVSGIASYVLVCLGGAKGLSGAGLARVEMKWQQTS
jgi:hypothetical protein